MHRHINFSAPAELWYNLPCNSGTLALCTSSKEMIQNCERADLYHQNPTMGKCQAEFDYLRKIPKCRITIISHGDEYAVNEYYVDIRTMNEVMRGDDGLDDPNKTYKVIIDRSGGPEEDDFDGIFMKLPPGEFEYNLWTAQRDRWDVFEESQLENDEYGPPVHTSFLPEMDRIASHIIVSKF